MPDVYEGDRPYIFICYEHADDAAVLPMIDALAGEGYRVWYDGGIQAGSSVSARRADHLHDCKCVVALVSSSWVASERRRKEVIYALGHNKPVLPVYLEDVELPRDLQMLLGDVQPLPWHAYATDEEFNERLFSASVLDPCLTDEGKRRRGVKPRNSYGQCELNNRHVSAIGGIGKTELVKAPIDSIVKEHEKKPQPLTPTEPVDDGETISVEMIRDAIEGKFEVITKSEIEESIPEITDGLSYMNDTFKLVDKDSQEVAGLLDNREVYENLNPETTLMLAELKANLLDAPVRRLQQHCSFYSEQTRLVDQSIDVLISQLGSLKDADAITYHVNMTLGPQIENLLSVNREYSSQIELMRSGLRDYSRLARVLREPCQQIEAALDNMESSATIIQSWKARLEADNNVTKDHLAPRR